MKRVVVTGRGIFSSIGHDWDSFRSSLKQGNSGVRTMQEWDRYTGLNTRLGGPIESFEVPSHFNRKKTRSMGRVALMATLAAERALQNAGLLGDPILTSGDVGVAFGSSAGSTEAAADLANFLLNEDMAKVNATTYIRMMSHTAPVNIGVFFGLKGRVYTTSSACTSGSQGLGCAFEAIRNGQQTVMVAGGAEELCPTEAAVFDALYATSTRNEQPETTPKPFDSDRDGLVIGEGAGALILEEREHALARGAHVYAEIVGYGTNSDGGHVTQPDTNTMQIAMELALESAQLDASAINYVNAHGTATARGDVAESQATARLFGNQMPFSGLKGHLGHTMGACGAIEAWASFEMMNDGWFCPTLNLENVDPECGELDYIIGVGRDIQAEYVMSNNFAFGGINTSLIFRRAS
ncbi:MAG: beta-ketoacyl-ACP synthase [Pseudomonadota bacterium]